MAQRTPETPDIAGYCRRQIGALEPKIARRKPIMKIIDAEFGGRVVVVHRLFGLDNASGWLQRAFAQRSATTINRFWARYIGLLAGISTDYEGALDRKWSAIVS